MFFMTPMSLGLTRYSRAGGIPSWVTPGPDGTLPTDLADYAGNRGWYDGHSYGSIDAYLAGASGTFSRGSDATYFDSAGILRTAGPNVLRITHDRVTGEALGALLEGGRTNLVPRSNDFSYHSNQNTGWAGSVEIIRTELENGWWKLDKTVTGGSFIGTSLGAVTGGETCVLRMELRADGATSVSVGIYSSEAPSWGAINQASARIVSGPGNVALSIGALANVTDLSPVETTVVEVIRTFLPENTGTKRIYVYPVSTISSSPAGSVLVRRAQAEAAPFASSNIATSGASAQRLADSLTFARAAPAEGTIVIEGRAAAGKSGSQGLLFWGTNTDYVYLVRTATGVLRWIVRFGNVEVLSPVLGAVADNGDFRAAVSWREGQCAVSLNGDPAIVSAAYAGPWSIPAPLRIGSAWWSGQEWFGTIARRGIFDRAYPAEQLPEVWA